MPYRVKLEAFEGPLDLLLFLIKKSEVEIYDIPIAEITQQYLEYLEIITQLDLEGAGDFILVAATLIRIKAQMLLPKPPLEEGEEEEDPRAELVRRLLEYQRFKEVAVQMSDLENHQRLLFPRAFFDHDFEANGGSYWQPPTNVTLFDLMGVFKQILARATVEKQHTIETLSVSTEEQIDFIEQELQIKDQLLFMALIERMPTKMMMIVTFIALLELIKRGRVNIMQTGSFGEIWIRRAA